MCGLSWWSQLFSLSALGPWGLLILADETHHAHVICKLKDVVWAVHCCTIMSQQNKQQLTEYTTLESPSAQWDGAGDAAPDPAGLRSLCIEIYEQHSYKCVLFVQMRKVKSWRSLWILYLQLPQRSLSYFIIQITYTYNFFYIQLYRLLFKKYLSFFYSLND